MKVAVLFCFVAAVAVVSALPGGWSEEKSADAEVKAFAIKLQKDVEDELHTKTLKVISYKKQVVNGTKYIIKVKAGNKYVHIKAFRSTGGAVSMVKIDSGHTRTDPITIF